MVFREITYVSVIMRILASIIVGGMFGMERSVKNHPAGLRTYMLVSVGSCLIMLTNQYIWQFTGAGDPMRLGAQVVSGIGFLGAGTILVTKRNQIKGLTTAAGLWASAGVGLAFGIGFYEGAITASVGIFFILTLLHKIEHFVNRKIRLLDIYVELDNALPLIDFVHHLKSQGFKIESLHLEPDSTPDGDSRAFVIGLKAGSREDHLILMDRISRLKGVLTIEEL